MTDAEKKLRRRIRRVVARADNTLAELLEETADLLDDEETIDWAAIDVKLRDAREEFSIMVDLVANYQREVAGVVS